MDNRNLETGKPKPLLVYIVTIYTASLLIANVLAGHMLNVFGQQVSAGILAFPITYILASVLAEVYGYRWARRAAWLSLALNALLAGFVQLSIMLPQPEGYDAIYFVMAIGGTWRIVLASLTAFTIGKFANDKLFSQLKGENTNMKGFTSRAIISSIVGHILDTSIFYLIAFSFVIPWAALPSTILVVVALKWGYELIVLPLTVMLAKKVSRYEAAA